MSKRMKAALEATAGKGAMSVPQAVALIKQCASVKFDETVELALNLGCLLYTSDAADD